MAGGDKTFLVEDAVKAHKALRAAAGLGPERFPVPAFVGMISDEVETLRGRGMTDEQIVGVIRSAVSTIDISAEEIARFYAPPEERRHP